MKHNKKFNEKEEQLNLALLGAGLGMWDWDMQHNVIRINDLFIQMLGYSTEDFKDHILTFKQWKALTHPKDFIDTLKLFTSHVNKKTELYESVFRMKHKNGEWVWILARGKVLAWSNDKPIRALGTHLDITEIKTTELKLKESEKRFSSLFEQAADGILVGIGQGEIIEANDSICKLTGYTKSELIGENIKILFDPNELGSTPLRYDLVKKGDTVIRERAIVRKDGTKVYTEMNTKILEDGRMQALFRDITRRKKAEIEAEKNRELLQKAELITGLGRYYYHVNEDKWESSEVLNKILGIDDNYEKNFKSWLDIIHPEFKQEMLDYFRINIIQNKEKFNKEYKIFRINDQKERWMHGMGEIILDENNQPEAVFGTIQDITERKQAELKIKESEEKYKSIFYSSPLGILHFNKEGFITDCNNRFVEIIGSSKEVLLGLDMFHKLNNPKMIETIKEALKNGESYYEDWYSSITANKSTYVRALFKRITEASGKVISGIGLIEDITEQKMALTALKESEEKYRLLIENQSDLVVKVDKEGRFLFVSPSYCEKFGKTERELLKKPFLSLIHESDRELTLKEMQKLHFPPHTCHIEHRALTNEGLKWLSWSDKAVLNEKGEIIEIIGIGRDITENKIAEQKVKEHQLFINRITEQTPDIIYIYDVNKSENIYMNKDIGKMLGYKTADLPANNIKALKQLMHPDDWKEFDNYDQIVKKWEKEYIKNYEYRLKDAKGNWRWFYGREKEFQRENNQIINLIGVVSDVTERKNAQNDLIENELKYRLLFENANDAIFIMDKDIFIDCNDKTLEIFKCKREQIIGKPPYLFSPEKQPGGENSKSLAKKRINEAILKGKNTFEWKHKRCSGDEFYAEVSLNVFELRGKTIIQAIVRDINERKQGEILLKQSEEKFRNIFSSSSDVIMILNENSVVIEVNESIEKNLGYTINEFKGKTPNDYIAAEERKDVEERIRKMIIGEKVPIKELAMISKSGKIIPFEVNSKLINYMGKKAILSVLRNIEERREMEQRIFETMIESEERERQRLASDIHDEIGPILSSLKMYIDTLDNSKTAEKQKYVKEKLQELVKETINNVREVSNALSPGSLNKYGLVSALSAFFNHQKDLIQISFNTNITSQRFGVKLETVYYRIIKELFNNTIKHAKAKKVDINLILSSNKLILDYRDNGIGINMEKVEKEKFTGMGLSNIENRIKTINGKYSIISGKTKGFQFSLETEIR